MPTFRPEFFLLDSRALQSADARAIVHGASRAELATLCVLLAHESGGDRSQSDLLGQHRERSRVQFGTVCREMGCALSQQKPRPGEPIGLA